MTRPEKTSVLYLLKLLQRNDECFSENDIAEQKSVLASERHLEKENAQRREPFDSC